MAKICKSHKEKVHKKHTKTLKKSEEPCPYCVSNDGLRDDCQYCQDLDAVDNADGTAGMDGCQMCAELDSGNDDDCPYCDEDTVGHSCNCPNCPKSDEMGIAAEDADPDSPDNCPECQKMYSEAPENEPDQNAEEDPQLQGHETAEQVLDLLDQEPGKGTPPKEEAQQIDNTELPQGDAMKDNVSVPENFGPAQKADVSDSEQSMSQDHDCNCPDCPGGDSADQGPVPGSPDDSTDSEDGPDMAGVLQSGLDDAASEQHKQQVMDMVGQTLAGFKSNKQSLEATKEQNQPLYNSCIQMLKSMIELCKLLGLQPKMPEAPQASTPSAAPQEGAAKDPKTQAG